MCASWFIVEDDVNPYENRLLEYPSWRRKACGNDFDTTARLAARDHRFVRISRHDGQSAVGNQDAEEQGVQIGAVNPNVFQDNEYKLGSFGNPDSGVQEQAMDHNVGLLRDYAQD